MMVVGINSKRNMKQFAVRISKNRQEALIEVKERRFRSFSITSLGWYAVVIISTVLLSC